MIKVDIELLEVSQVHDLFPELDTEPRPHLLLAAADQPADVGGGGGALVDDEVAVRRRDPGAAKGHALEARAINQRAGCPRDAVCQAIPGGNRILKHAAGTGGVEWLRPLA